VERDQADNTGSASDEEGDPPAFAVEGVLVGGDAETLDLLLSPYLLTIDRRSVVAIEEVAAPEQLLPGRGHAVRMQLEVGARIRNLASAAGWEAELWRRRRSFAVATRREPPESQPESQEYSARSREFLARHGITEEEPT
jgi:hypothetical protein